MGAGPLSGVRVLELAGIGPGPFGCMILADLGADVVRVERPGGGPWGYGPRDRDSMNRGKRSLEADLRDPDAVERVLTLVERADALVDSFRPGVTERLGVGPEVCLRRNPRLVYGRVTGWGQTGPLAHTAGHDIGYVALTGALHTIGEAGGPPIPPLSFLGDFAGGGLYLAVGVLAGLMEARVSGRGQVVDAAIVDGVSHVTSLFRDMLRNGLWRDERGANIVDGSTPYYAVYRTSDDGYMSVGAIEPRFYAEFVRLIGLDDDPAVVHGQRHPDEFPALRKRFADAFATRTRAEWTAHFDGSEACVAPVLSLTEAPEHPHLRARETFVEYDGFVQPAPAPRFSRTPGAIGGRPPLPGQDTDDVLADWLGS